jgi:hypothetical protein
MQTFAPRLDAVLEDELSHGTKGPTDTHFNEGRVSGLSPEFCVRSAVCSRTVVVIALLEEWCLILTKAS